MNFDLDEVTFKETQVRSNCSAGREKHQVLPALQPQNYSQGPSVSRCTEAFAGLMMTGGTIETLTLQQAVFSIKAGVTELLTAPALVAISADTGSSYRVTFGPITALTAVTAVGTPEVTLTAWAKKESMRVNM